MRNINTNKYYKFALLNICKVHKLQYFLVPKDIFEDAITEKMINDEDCYESEFEYEGLIKI